MAWGVSNEMVTTSNAVAVKRFRIVSYPGPLLPFDDILAASL